MIIKGILFILISIQLVGYFFLNSGWVGHSALIGVYITAISDTFYQYHKGTER